jgi:hypothetical protein
VPLRRGDVPFHCALHAQSVMGYAHCLTRQLRECNHGPLSELEVLALYVAAMGHDAGHFGWGLCKLLYKLHPSLPQLETVLPIE